MALTIGKVAKAANVHVETLRYYERRGLVRKPPRSLSLYRRYPESTAPGSVRQVRAGDRLLAARDSRAAVTSSGAEGSVRRRETAGRQQAPGHRGEDPRAAGDASRVETIGLAVRREAALALRHFTFGPGRLRYPHWRDRGARRQRSRGRCARQTKCSAPPTHK